MEIIEPHCEWIRTFSCTDGNEISPRVAHEMGLKTLVGAWIGDRRRRRTKRRWPPPSRSPSHGHADILAIGNEVLLREDISEDELIASSERAKEACPNVPISYVDAYYLFESTPALVEACDCS